MRVGGADAIRGPIAVKRTIGAVTQFDTLDRACTVRESLVYHYRCFGICAAAARIRADELLAAFTLAERRSADVVELSASRPPTPHR